MDAHRADQPTCADVEALLPLIADGAIDAASDASVFAHLSHCDDCQEALARHDLIGLAIGAGGVATGDPHAPIHYRLPAPVAWATAAALLAAIGGVVSWSAGRGDAAGTGIASREVIRVVTPGEPAHRPYYLIRDGERLDPAQLDFGADEAPTDAAPAPAGAVPVGMHY